MTRSVLNRSWWGSSILALSFAGIAPAQSDWSAAYPVPRVEPAMALLDTQIPNEVPHIVMFGGLTDPASTPSAGAPLGDTWIWAGGEWTRHEQANGPQRRNAAAMCRGPNNTLVLFGGLNAGTILNDTWTWDGTQWNLQFPNMSPPPRDLHAMAYDAGRGRVVMFGGSTPNPNGGAAIQLNDTWEWDGVSWTQVSTQNTPSIREGHVMVYSAADSSIYLHGGWNSTGSPVFGTLSAELFKYTPGGMATWTSVATTSRAVAYHYGGYDPDSSNPRIILGGGIYLNTTPTSTAFANNTRAWLVNPSSPAFPPTFGGHAMSDVRMARYGMAAGDLDGNGHKFYLFKGPGAAPERSSTVEFHSTNGSWSNSVLQRWNGPLNSNGGAMVFDESRGSDGRMVLLTGSAYYDVALGPVAPTCHLQIPRSSDRASVGWSLPGVGPCPGNTTGAVSFDDFIGDWSRGQTFELDPGATGVDRGWVRIDAGANDPNGSTMNAGGGVGLSYLNSETYRLGGYELGHQPWLNYTSCEVNPNFPCGGGTVRQRVLYFRYDPLRNQYFDDGLYRYLGPQSGNNSSWTRVSSYPLGPIAFHGQYADPDLGRLVVFGGSRQTPASSDANIRVFNPTSGTWTTYTPPLNADWPSPRFGHRMVYDSRRKVAVMFGGFELSSAMGAVLNDTWELRWDSGNSQFVWKLIDYTGTPGQRPAGRMLHSMVYDPVRQRSVVFGGIARPFKASGGDAWPFRTKPPLTTYPGSFSDVWEWDGETWEMRTPANVHTERFAAASAWDPITEQSLSFGGMVHAGVLPTVFAARFEGVDSFGPEVLAQNASLGVSCPTVGNSITPAVGQRPYMGTDMDISWTLPNSSATYSPILYVGFQQQTLNLGFVGLPQCHTFATLDLPIFLANNQNTFTVEVPDGPLGGIPVYLTVALIDTANPAVVAEVTDALQMTIEMR